MDPTLYGITAEYQGWRLTNVVEADSLEKAIDQAKTEFASMFKTSDDVEIREVSLIKPDQCKSCREEIE